MFKFLLFIVFFVILLILLAGFSVIRTIKSLFFGNSHDASQKRHAASSSRRQHDASTGRKPLRKKVIGEDEGEYVDYEEIKE